MNQRTHAWIAIRAVALLEDEGEAKDLVKLLKPHVKAAAIGAWIPDLQDSKLGSGKTDNHILKMKPYRGGQRKRFTVTKPEMMKRLGSRRMINSFLSQDDKLKDSWWDKPYRAEPKQPGQHLANRAMAISTTMIDLLIFGNQNIAKLLPRKIGFTRYLTKDELTRKEQAVLFFFMLSHFIADACMPCHCDARKLASYDDGHDDLHHDLEMHWSKLVGTAFEKKKLQESRMDSDEILGKAREVDEKYDIHFTNQVPGIVGEDIWKEAITLCRASFALACIISPPEKYPYTKNRKSPFKEVFAGEAGEELLENVDRITMHDAVLNVAIVWKHIWKKFIQKKK